MMFLKLLWLPLSSFLYFQVLAQDLELEEILRDWAFRSNKRSMHMQCRDPDENELQSQWTTESGTFCDHHSFNHHSFRSILPLQQLDELTGMSPTYSTILLRQAGFGSLCSPPQGGNTPTRMRSHCPWWYIRSTNSSRYPRQLDVAELSCRSHDNCIDEQGRPMSSYKCEAIHMDVPVLVKTGAKDKRGFCIYKSHYERVPVGFTCAHIKISNSPLAGGKREDEYIFDYGSDVGRFPASEILG